MTDQIKIDSELFEIRYCVVIFFISLESSPVDKIDISIR